MRTFLILSLIILSVASWARKPAVEDFVGVEPDSYQPNTEGTQVLFNFQNSMNKSLSDTSAEYFTYFFLSIFASLPFFMWIGLTKEKAKNKKSQNVVRITRYEDRAENVNNIKYLDDYKTHEKDTKKAS